VTRRSSDHTSLKVSCYNCAHFRWSHCIAYPDGIPLAIISGQVDHLVPRPGQVGDAVFEPMNLEIWERERRRVPVQRQPAPTSRD
jgi:hypothetical protein